MIYVVWVQLIFICMSPEEKLSKYRKYGKELLSVFGDCARGRREIVTATTKMRTKNVLISVAPSHYLLEQESTG